MALRTKRVFERHDEVEICCSKEKGFLGSYYAATIIANMGDNYVVEYKELVEDDEVTPLRETVMAHDVRPPPPNQTVPSKEEKEALNRRKKFRYGDLIDAYANDGWWVGVITGKRGCYYSVFFETTWEHIAYPVSHLRLHLAWRHGRWFSCKDRKLFLKNNPSVSPEGTSRVLQEMFPESINQEDNGKRVVTQAVKNI